MSDDISQINNLVADARDAQGAYEAMGSQDLFDRACQAVAWCLMEPERNRALADGLTPRDAGA